MKQELRNKQFGLKRFLKSFLNSWEGLKYAYTHEQSMFLHGLLTFVSVVFGFVLKITKTEWIVIITLLCVLLVIELLNTAIEATCDAITEEYHPLIKIAKDAASASACIAALVTVVVECVIFLPLIINLL